MAQAPHRRLQWLGIPAVLWVSFSGPAVIPSTRAYLLRDTLALDTLEITEVERVRRSAGIVRGVLQMARRYASFKSASTYDFRVGERVVVWASPESDTVFPERTVPFPTLAHVLNPALRTLVGPALCLAAYVIANDRKRAA